jgi:NitT/TauT family transport system permease protein
MIWNITFGVYEAVKTIPDEFFEIGRIFNLSPLERLRKILIPASMTKVIEQSALSWSIGLFYLVTSEIFSTGNAAYTVKYGIGVALTNLAFSGNFGYYLVGIGVFIGFVIATRFLLFGYLKKRFQGYTINEKRAVHETKKSPIVRAIDRINPFSKSRSETVRRGVLSARERIAKPMVVIGVGAKHAKRAGGLAKRNIYDYRYLVYVALLFFAIYLVYTHLYLVPTYAGYEYTVLLAMAATLARIWLVFLIILAISIPVGVYLIFMSRRSESYLLLFQIIASIPATILLPLIAVSLKNAPFHNELVAFVVFFLSGIWYLVFSIMSNKNTIPSSVYEVKSIFGVKGKKAWKDIYVKAIMPGIITGSITAIAAEWNASIVAERFTTTAVGNGTVITSVNLGLGKLLDTSLASGNLTLMVIALINLTIVIILINKLFWKRTYNKVLTPYK